jgi:hypothetical protein
MKLTGGGCQEYRAGLAESESANRSVEQAWLGAQRPPLAHNKIDRPALAASPDGAGADGGPLLAATIGEGPHFWRRPS